LSVGNKWKWKQIQDLVGAACQVVGDQVMTDNNHNEIKLMKSKLTKQSKSEEIVDEDTSIPNIGEVSVDETN
jgi:hypothetical protein